MKENDARKNSTVVSSQASTISFPSSDVDSQQTIDSQLSTQSLDSFSVSSYDNLSVVGSLQSSDLDRMNSFMSQNHHDSQQDHLNMSQSDLIKHSSPKLNGQALTEEEAFWLDTTPTSSTTTSPTSTVISFSQPLPPKSSMLDDENATITEFSSTQQPRLVLGSSQTKRKHLLPKTTRRLHNPYLRRQQLNQQAQQQHKTIKQYFMSQPLTEKTNTNIELSLSMSQPTKGYYSNSVKMTTDDDDDEEERLFKIEEHKVNPFRHYDPSLFHWDDPTFFVGPGFFNSNKVSRSFMIPFLSEPSRRRRVLRKLEKGTLGIVSAENKAMEEDVDEDLRHFIEANSIPDSNSFESAITSIDEKTLNDTAPAYKKKPLQRRQTRLFKLKFID
ncbi:MAG: hypothetical protein EXX96DRAFT_570578 [Benjaminiella poitrasii]|nr:MAG: hypothetical protein EXX96DRAFT_570578 [Benjaminiella poitrasii]